MDVDCFISEGTLPAVIDIGSTCSNDSRKFHTTLYREIHFGLGIIRKTLKGYSGYHYIIGFLYILAGA